MKINNKKLESQLTHDQTIENNPSGFVKNESKSSKMDESESVTLLIETVNEVGDNNVGNTLPRRIRRKLKSLLKKPRVFKRFRFEKEVFAKQDIVEVQKFSMICFVATPSQDQTVVELFHLMSLSAWELFKKIGGLIVQFFQQSVPAIANKLAKLIMKDPYFILYASLACGALLSLNYLFKRFGKNLKAHNRLILIILSLITAWLVGEFITSEGLKNILLWLKNLILRILLILPNRNSSIDASPPAAIKNPEVSNTDGLRSFLFYSVLTIVTFKYLLRKFKEKLVNAGPLTPLIIDLVEIVDIDGNKWIPL